MKKLAAYVQNRRPISFRTGQCLYGVSVALTFFVVGQLAMHL